MTPLDSA